MILTHFSIENGALFKLHAHKPACGASFYYPGKERTVDYVDCPQCRKTWEFIESQIEGETVVMTQLGGPGPVTA